jgi:hypothetical protein
VCVCVCVCVCVRAVLWFVKEKEIVLWNEARIKARIEGVEPASEWARNFSVVCIL